MRTTIKVENNVVALCYDSTSYDMAESRVRREFMVPAGGGYVREWDAYRREWVQVCDRLANRGNTLYVRDGGITNLLAVIRREWRAARRDEKRESVW